MNELQQRLLGLLAEVDEICRKHGIVYYLHAGNALGAARHRGFIPWDDDMDIVMTMENWNKFYKAFHEEKRGNRALECNEDYPGHLYLYKRYVDTTTTAAFQWRALSSKIQGLSVDIFIFAPLPDDKEQQDRFRHLLEAYAELRNRRYAMSITISDETYDLYKHYNKVSQEIGLEAALEQIQTEMTKLCSSKPAYYMQCMGSGYNWMMPAELMGEPEEVEIGGHKFYVTPHPRRFVRAAFRDTWMFLPAREERKTHAFTVSLKVPCQEFETLCGGLWVNEKRYNNCYYNRKPYDVEGVYIREKQRKVDAQYYAAAFEVRLRRLLERHEPEFAELQKQGRYWELKELLQPYYTDQLLPVMVAAEVAIPIGEDMLRLACETLVNCGLYFSAQRILDIHFGRENKRPEAFQEIQEQIDVSRRLSIACYDDEDYEEAAVLVEEWLPRMPDNLDFRAAALFLKLKKSGGREDISTIRAEAERMLVAAPGYRGAKMLVADAMRMMGEIAEAEAAYRELWNATDDGMLKLRIEDISKEAGFTLEEKEVNEEIAADEEAAVGENETIANEAETSEAAAAKKEAETGAEKAAVQSIEKGSVYEEPEDEIHRVILALLKDFDAICREAGIPYFLGRWFAGTALETGTFNENFYNHIILMHPAHRKRLIEAVANHPIEGRMLESFESNPRYVDFTMQYGDLNTSAYTPVTDGFYRYPCICLRIFFIRPNEKSKFRRKFNTGVNAAMEATALPSVFYNGTKQKIFAGIMANMVYCVLGRRRAKTLFWNWIYRPKHTPMKIQGRIKEWLYKYSDVCMLDFNKKSEAYLNGYPFPVPVNKYEYIGSGRITHHMESDGKKRWVSMWPGIPCEEFTKNLQGKDLAKKRAKLYKEYLDKVSRGNDLYLPYLNRSWNIMDNCKDIWHLYQTYMPQKEKIRELYKADDYDALREVLKEYTQLLFKNARRGMGVRFDSELFRIEWALLEHDKLEWVVGRSFNGKQYARIDKIKKAEVGRRSMKKATKDLLPKIIQYIEKDYVHCLYLYIDLTVYGLDNPNISLWYDADERGICKVAMKYHETFQLYADRDYENVEPFVRLMEQHMPMGICARKEIIEALTPHLSDYDAEYGAISQHRREDLNKLRARLANYPEADRIELAGKEDATEIAALICSDEELGSQYTVESLAKQIVERIETGMGRSYIIRDDGKIVAHMATFAECDRFVISAGMIIHPDYRDTLFAFFLVSRFALDIEAEGKETFAMLAYKRLLRAYKRSGNTVVAEYGKLVPRRERQTIKNTEL